MNSVRRYSVVPFVNRGGKEDAKMFPSENGEWVEYEDYAALEREMKDGDRDALIEQRDALKAELARLRDQDRHRGGSGWWMNLPPKDWTE